MGKKNAGKNNARIIDWQLYYQAGIDPKTMLPIKMSETVDYDLRKEIYRTLEVIDRQDYVNRGVWYNLPPGIDSQELERMMYIKGQLAFFYEKTTEPNENGSSCCCHDIGMAAGKLFYPRRSDAYDANGRGYVRQFELRRKRQLL